MTKNRRTLAISLGLGVALLFASAALAIHDLANSNRPHELTAVPFVFAMMVMNVVLQLLVARQWVVRLHERSADSRPLHLGDILLGLIIAAYQICSVILLLASGGTWLSQLTAD